MNNDVKRPRTDKEKKKMGVLLLCHTTTEAEAVRGAHTPTKIKHQFLHANPCHDMSSPNKTGSSPTAVHYIITVEKTQKGGGGKGWNLRVVLLVAFFTVVDLQSDFSPQKQTEKLITAESPNRIQQCKTGSRYILQCRGLTHSLLYMVDSIKRCVFILLSTLATGERSKTGRQQ